MRLKSSGTILALRMRQTPNPEPVALCRGGALLKGPFLFATLPLMPLNITRPYLNSRSLTDLDPACSRSVQSLINNMKSKYGHTFVPFSTLRGPGSQATLYAQSRTPAQVEHGYVNRKGQKFIGWREMERLGAPYLASLLRKAPTATTAVSVTNSLPGQSWHHYGMACDLYLERDGAADWDDPAYGQLVNEARLVGLTTVSWEKVHVQLLKQGVPPYSWPDMDRMLNPGPSPQDSSRQLELAKVA